MVVRHLIRALDSRPGLHPAPSPPPAGNIVESYHISLSPSQEAQIREIFNLFDTDGGGTIDKNEMDLAMVALGFHSPKSKEHNGALVEEIVGDGVVTLEEFSALMMGELSGKAPQETLRAVFALLSRSESDQIEDSLITFKNLQSVCRKYKVSLDYRIFFNYRFFLIKCVCCSGAAVTGRLDQDD